MSRGSVHTPGAGNISNSNFRAADIVVTSLLVTASLHRHLTISHVRTVKNDKTRTREGGTNNCIYLARAGEGLR